MVKNIASQQSNTGGEKSPFFLLTRIAKLVISRQRIGENHMADYETYEVQVFNNGNKYWYQNDKLHRTDGPAVEYSSGYKEWWKNDKLHRENGPAIEYADGSKSWWLNHKRHRTDGPAIEYANGKKYWYIDGNEYSFSEWCEKTNLSREEKCELVLMYG